MNLNDLQKRASDLLWDVTHDMRKLAVAAFIVFAVGVGVGYANNAHADFQRGETLSHMLSVCLDKSDAIEIAKADEKGGLQAAATLFGAKEKCAPIPIQGYKVGKTVFSVQSVREGAKVTVSVVEILNGDKVEAYFITSAPVTDSVKGVHGEALVLKPERNA